MRALASTLAVMGCMGVLGCVRRAEPSAATDHDASVDARAIAGPEAAQRAENDASGGGAGGGARVYPRGGADGGSGGGGGRMNPPAGGMGGPSCGLPSAAFCDTFDAPSAVRGRGGDLDPRRWSASRGEPQLPTGNGVTLGIGPATVPPCRPGLPKQVFPDDDVIVCEPTADVASSHLLVAVGAQNYGQTSLRIRQPFDFAGRTGTIVFDAEGYVLSPLLGWISVEITEDPAPIPSFSLGGPGVNNNEGAAVPRNALEVHFANNCAGYVSTPHFAVSVLDVLTEYKDDVRTPEKPVCVPSQEGKLNHFELRVSEARVEVWASPFSTDGVTFPPPMMIAAADVRLPFSRGYVQLTTHNHATLKYSHDGSYGAKHLYDAWLARWDNVGFDGPIVDHQREHEVGDALVPGKDAWNISGPVMSIGYRVADAAKAPNQTLHFQDVVSKDVARAQLALGAWYDIGGKSPVDFVLRYRLNGKPWHDRPFTPAEIAVLTNGHAQGAIAQVMDVPVAELVDGDNTLEFVTVNVPQGYPPLVSSIDLVLTTR